MTALLSEIFLFLVRAACKLRSMSYGPKHTSVGYTILCVITSTTRKLKVVQVRFTYRAIALLLEISILLVRAVDEIPSVSYGSKHASKPLCISWFCAY